MGQPIPGNNAVNSVGDEKSALIKRVAEALGFLKRHGFKSPVVAEKGPMTIVSVLENEIALEVELDWREAGVFLLVVRLENGNPPGGYYISGGKPCRYHLLQVIEDQKFDVDPNLVSEVRTAIREQGKNRNKVPESMDAQVTALAKVLKACISQLLQAQEEIFRGKA